MSTLLRGQVERGTATTGRVRVAGLDTTGQVVAETLLALDGSWELPSAAIAWLLVRQVDGAIAASVVPVGEAASLELPRKQVLRADANDPPRGARLWLDPISLDGFPDEFLGALRLHLGGLVDLHLADIAMDAGPIEIELQPGRYRVDGGLIALHPGQLGAKLASAHDLSSNASLPVLGEGFQLTVASDLSLQIAFATEVRT